MAGFLNTAMVNMAIVLLYNALSCLLFIQLFGFIGAALSTATTYLLSVFLWHYFINKKMGLNLIGGFTSDKLGE
jgi:O-antigen/teichoic acid export membrane protein